MLDIAYFTESIASRTHVRANLIFDAKQFICVPCSARDTIMISPNSLHHLTGQRFPAYQLDGNTPAIFDNHELGPRRTYNVLEKVNRSCVILLQGI